MRLQKILLIAAAIAAIALFFILDLHLYLTLESLKRNHQRLQEYYTEHTVVMVGGFMLIYILQTALSLPGAAILSLAAGAIFGAALGTVYAVIAATIGATLAFLVTRYLLRDLVLARFGTRLAGINQELEARGFNYLLFLRLVPLFPFFLINLAAGVTRLPLRTFVLGTLLGIIPGGFVIVNAGASLVTISSKSDLMSQRVFWSLVLLGCFALLPALYTRSTGRNR